MQIQTPPTQGGERNSCASVVRRQEIESERMHHQAEDIQCSGTVITNKENDHNFLNVLQYKKGRSLFGLQAHVTLECIPSANIQHFSFSHLTTHHWLDLEKE